MKVRSIIYVLLLRSGDAFTQQKKTFNVNARDVQSAFAAFVIAFSAGTTSPLPADASSYTSLSPEQKFVAEAWREVDSTYLDRSFNGQDWFKIRQELVKKKYKSMDEAQGSVSEMMSRLGDKYTRYLTPAKYQSIFDSATGSLAGVGVEIATNKEGIPIVSDVEPNSPAQKAGLMPMDLFIEGLLNLTAQVAVSFIISMY